MINATMTCTAAFHFTNTEITVHSTSSTTVALCKDKQGICVFIFKITRFLNNQDKKVTYLLICSTLLITLVMLCNCCLSAASSLHSLMCSSILLCVKCYYAFFVLFKLNILTSAGLTRRQYFPSRS